MSPSAERGRTPLFRYGLIGYPVSHSLSPAIFHAAFEASGIHGSYDLYQIAPAELDSRVPELVAGGLRGFNVTVPHKMAVIPMMKELDDSSVLTGAVNTVVVGRDGLVGYNTDMGGFADSLKHLGVRDTKGAAVVVLGAGGAARAVVAALGKKGADTIIIANRFPEETTRLLASLAPRLTGVRFETADLWDDSLAEMCSGALLCVQATSLGLRPDDPLPMDPALLPEGCFVYDLVYGSGNTPFVTASLERGLKAADGREMLLRQAARNFSLWLRTDAPVEAMRDGMGRELKRREG